MTTGHFMGGRLRLLHPAPTRCTKCRPNRTPIKGQCTNFILLNTHYSIWLTRGRADHFSTKHSTTRNTSRRNIRSRKRNIFIFWVWTL